jgi:hypothetical protein
MNLLTMNESQQPIIATSEHSGTWKEELSRRNAEIGETPGEGGAAPIAQNGYSATSQYVPRHPKKRQNGHVFG